jgi:hypothetical protein
VLRINIKDLSIRERCSPESGIGRERGEREGEREGRGEREGEGDETSRYSTPNYMLHLHY